MSQIQKNIKNKGKQWEEKALFRRRNHKWLSYSRKIAIRILSAIEDNPEINQKKLADKLKVSPQQVSKIVKGQENLTLQTIANISEVLNVELVVFPNFKYNQNLINYDAITNIFVWNYVDMQLEAMTLLQNFNQFAELTKPTQILQLNVTTNQHTGIISNSGL